MAYIRKRKNGGWQVAIRKKGLPIQHKTFPKKALAEAWARKTEEELITNTFINDSASKMTVAQMMERYRDEITPRKKSKDVEKYRVQHLVNHLGEYTIENLSPEVIINYIDMRMDKVTSDTVRKEIGLLSLAIDAAMALWKIQLPFNPVTKVRGVLKVTKTLKRENKRDRRPTDEELQILYTNLPGLMPQITEYAIETGMRRGEIANQRVEHRNSITLHIPETKTDQPRTIPLSKRAREILDSLPNREDGYVWGYKDVSITHAFMRVCRKFGISDLHFHDLRHEAASRFFEKGLNVAEVAKITGQTFATLQRYTHLKAVDIVQKLE